MITKTVNPILQAAAKDLVARVGSPADLLDFLATATYKLHKQDNDVRFDDKDHEFVFSTAVLIEHVVQPWFAFCNKEESLFDELAKGFEDFIDFNGAEHYRSLIGAIMITVGHDLHMGGLYLPYEQKRTSILNALLFLYYPLAEYEEKRRREKAGEQ